MLTREKVLEEVRKWAPTHGAFIDGRDRYRLAAFFPNADLDAFGMKVTDETRKPVDWTEKNVLSALTADVAFGFEKALGRRGISSELMWHVVLMWLWVLEHPLYEQHRDMERYPMYGLPLLKEVAVAFDLPNPIGDDRGDEPKYSDEEDGG